MNNQNQNYNHDGQYHHTPPTPPSSDRPGYTKAIASLVCGIVAILLPIPFIDLAAGIVGIVLARKSAQEGFSGGMRTAGFVVSIVGTVYAAIFTISFLACIPFLPLMWMF